MKRFLSIMLCAVMLCTMAACGKKQAETTTEPETTQAQTTTATEPVSKTDKNAKAEDVIKAAGEILTKEDARFAFSGDAALDLSVIFKPSAETLQQMPASVQAVINLANQLLLDENGELNIKLGVGANGFTDAAKGTRADITFSHNLSEKIKAVLALISSVEPDDPSLSWLTDTLTSKLYQDKEAGKVYFLNPIKGEWNYSETKADAAGIKPVSEETEIKLDELFEPGYEWTITDEKYILSGTVNAKVMAGEMEDEQNGEASETESGADRLMEDIALKLTMTFNDEKHLESAEIAAVPFEKVLDDLFPGLTVKLSTFTVSAAFDYQKTEDFAVPAEVTETAVPFEMQNPLDPSQSDPQEAGYPWAEDVFTLKDTVLADNDNFTLTASRMQVDEFGDMQLLFTFENKTKETLAVRMNDMYLNGLKWNGFIYEDVDPESSMELALDIYAGEMQVNQQEHVYNLDLFMEVRKQDDYFGDPLLNEHFEVSVQDGEAEPVEPDEALALIKTEDLEAYWTSDIEISEWSGVNFSFLCRNGKDVPVRFEVSKLSVEGQEVPDIWWETEIRPGFAGLSRDSIGTDFLEENQIGEITRLEGTIRAYHVDENYEESVYAENDFVITYQDGKASVAITPAE